MTRPLLSFFAVLLLGVPVVRACPPYRSYATPYRAPVVHEEVVPVAAVFVPIAVPLYGVSFNPNYLVPPALTSAQPVVPASGGPLAATPGAAAAPAPTVSPSAAAAQPSGAGRLAPTGPGVALLASKCASCHGADVSAAKGHGLTLFSGGQLVPVNDALALKIVRQVATGKMPRGSTLADPEIESILSVFDAPTKTSPPSPASAPGVSP